jgi:hypothetical protein
MGDGGRIEAANAHGSRGRLPKPIGRYPMYRRRSFDADIIELCVRWYITAG